MRIFFGVAVHMVHAVHHSIGPWNQKGRSLNKPGTYIKNTLPVLADMVHFMGSIPVQKKGMKKQGQKPMGAEKQEDCKHSLINCKLVR